MTEKKEDLQPYGEVIQYTFTFPNLTLDLFKNDSLTYNMLKITILSKEFVCNKVYCSKLEKATKKGTAITFKKIQNEAQLKEQSAILTKMVDEQMNLRDEMAQKHKAHILKEREETGNQNFGKDALAEIERFEQNKSEMEEVSKNPDEYIKNAPRETREQKIEIFDGHLKKVQECGEIRQAMNSEIPNEKLNTLVNNFIKEKMDKD